jgi:hypothetical protein
VLVAGFAFSLVVSACVTLWGMYHYGFLHTGGATDAGGNGWIEAYLIGTGDTIHQLRTTPEKPDPSGLVAIGAGAAMTILLGVTRLRFWWWPLHPVGYMLSNLAWGMNRHFLQFFIGWVLKSAALRWGGLRLYWRTVPIAVGVIVGDQLDTFTWVIVSMAIGRFVQA